MKKSSKKSPKSKKAASASKPKAAKKEKPIGVVTHYYSNLEVAIVKFNKAVKAGTQVHFKGATTDFKETVKSMQYDHKPIQTAPKGKQVGIKVDQKVREGDEVFAAE